jgi:hypothetical protein
MEYSIMQVVCLYAYTGNSIKTHKSYTRIQVYKHPNNIQNSNEVTMQHTATRPEFQAPPGRVEQKEWVIHRWSSSRLGIQLHLPPQQHLHPEGRQNRQEVTSSKKCRKHHRCHREYSRHRTEQNIHVTTRRILPAVT